MYILTPQGISRTIELPHKFLKKRISEYDTIRAEIEELKRDMDERETHDVTSKTHRDLDKMFYLIRHLKGRKNA